MKLAKVKYVPPHPGPLPPGEGGQRAAAARGHTLVEAMIATALGGLVITAMAVCNISGIKFNEFVRPKLENARYARKTLGTIIEEVRCASSVQVGTGTSGGFTAAGSTNAQWGNALRIYPSTNLAQYIYYFRD